jgi:hypothetical protein
LLQTFDKQIFLYIKKYWGYWKMEDRMKFLVQTESDIEEVDEDEDFEDSDEAIPNWV